ncbi:uncharacterized protein LOC142615556 isoform X2 [Castanea sativa]
MKPAILSSLKATACEFTFFVRLLDPIKEQFPTLSYADFYQLYIKKYQLGICIMCAFLSCFSLKKNKQKPQYQEAIILASEISCTKTICVISKIDQAASNQKALAAVQGPSRAFDMPWVALIGQSVAIILVMTNVFTYNKCDFISLFLL